jgi:glutamate/tyrosine decarboxylase-like PLP-dependent enzyme
MIGHRRRRNADAGGSGRAAVTRPLDAGAAGIAALERLAAGVARRWRATRRTAPIVPTRRQVGDLAPRFTGPLPWHAEPMERLRGDLDALARLSRRNDSPRFWGYVSPPGTTPGTVADGLAAVINQNLTAFRSAPGASLVEIQVIDWIREIVGLPRGAYGVLTSGGSMANLAGLAAARDAAVPFDLGRRGLRGEAGPPLVLYASEEAHHSIAKAAALLGIGRDYVRGLPVDSRLRMDVGALRDAVTRDRRARLAPFAVAASAGTVTTGAVDPLRDIWRLCRRERLWLHVDACYGGFAVLAPSGRPRLRGLSLADSIALDPHKWLYAPVDAGCVLYRRPEAARRAFRVDADYTRMFGAGRLEQHAFWDYGPELSRRFRALKIWLGFKYHGAGEFARAIEEDLRLARVLARKVREAPRLELLSAGDLGIVCFRYVPPGPRRPEAELGRVNERLLVDVQQEGRVFVSNARVRGRFALRACLVNYRTTEVDLDLLVQRVQAIGRTTAVAGRKPEGAAGRGRARTRIGASARNGS